MGFEEPPMNAGMYDMFRYDRPEYWNTQMDRMPKIMTGSREV